MYFNFIHKLLHFCGSFERFSNTFWSLKATITPTNVNNPPAIPFEKLPKNQSIIVGLRFNTRITNKYRGDYSFWLNIHSCTSFVQCLPPYVSYFQQLNHSNTFFWNFISLFLLQGRNTSKNKKESIFILCWEQEVLYVYIWNQ